MRGDVEQWVFPNVIMTKLEQKELIATVVQIATEALFRKHFYNFGGKTYQQRSGGPIGLRGTCAVARVCMQLWDIKWKNKIGNLGIKTWLLGRYMDDACAFLPSLWHAWRRTEAGLCYTQE